MKAVFVSLLFLSVVVCNPFHLKDEQDCTFCKYMDRSGDCNCDDVNWCREVQCNELEKCEACEAPPKEEKRTVIQEPEIVPATAAPVGKDSEQDCSFCEYMHLTGDCICDDVNWCRGVQCNVPEECDEACPEE